MKVICILPKEKKDYMASMIIEGLLKNGIEPICNSLSNKSITQFNDDEILECIKHSNIDAVLLIWAKEGVAYLHYIREMARKIREADSLLAITYIDGSEWSYTGNREPGQDYIMRKGINWINQNLIMDGNIDYYFKRELYEKDPEFINTLLFAAMDENIYKKPTDKDIDVFCAFGHELTGLRKEVKEVCQKLKGEGFNVVIGQNYPYDQFLELTARSSISIDAWGAGDCNIRLFEIIANKTCCLYQRYAIETGPNWFEEDNHIIGYSNIYEFENKIRLLLGNKKKCTSIANAGFKHLLNYHTAEKRVLQLLNIIT